MENLLAIVRGIVLVGAVILSFLIIGFGFYIVAWEYEMLKTRKQIEEFLRMTNDAGLQADLTKGTVMLGRTRPGILMIAIGAILLTICMLRPFEFQTIEQQTGDPVKQHIPLYPPGREIQGNQPQQPTPPATEKVQEEPKQSKVQPDIPNKVLYVPWPVNAPSTNSQSPMVPVTSATGKLTVEGLEELRISILNKWLESVSEIEGKNLETQMNILNSKYGNAAAGYEALVMGNDSTLEQAAQEAYGDTKYLPLLLAFNPSLKNSNGRVPGLKSLNVIQPIHEVVQQWTSVRRKSIRINATDPKADIYERLLSQAEEYIERSEYRDNPSNWWERAGGIPAFERALNNRTGRKWQTKIYQPEEGETAKNIAKIYYGASKFYKLLAFFNPQMRDLLGEPDKPLPPNSMIYIVHLSEY